MMSGNFFQMRFYVSINKDGTYHVQNAVAGNLGQHHVHTKDGFEKWKKDVDSDAIKMLNGQCNCGLDIGYVKSHTGTITYNPDF